MKIIKNTNELQVSGKIKKTYNSKMRINKMFLKVAEVMLNSNFKCKQTAMNIPHNLQFSMLYKFGS